MCQYHTWQLTADSQSGCSYSKNFSECLRLGWLLNRVQWHMPTVPCMWLKHPLPTVLLYRNCGELCSQLVVISSTVSACWQLNSGGGSELMPSCLHSQFCDKHSLQYASVACSVFLGWPVTEISKWPNFQHKLFSLSNSEWCAIYMFCYVIAVSCKFWRYCCHVLVLQARPNQLQCGLLSALCVIPKVICIGVGWSGTRDY